MLKPFHVPVGYLYVFFREMSIQFLCPFFNRIVCFLFSTWMASAAPVPFATMTEQLPLAKMGFIFWIVLNVLPFWYGLSTACVRLDK